MSSGARGCEFPANWQGTWFESGVGDVTVTSRNISRKGFCLENVDNFYLLENQYAAYSALMNHEWWSRYKFRHETVLLYGA